MTMHTITKIEAKKNKVFIEIDGEHHLFLYETETKKGLFKNRIQVSEVLTLEDMEALDKVAINRGKRRVMYLLARQDYPKAQLESKLKQDGYSQGHITKILESFEEKGYVNDERLVLQKVNQYKNYKSRREIEYVLRNKGFQSEAIKESVKTELSDESEIESALYLVRKKFDTKRNSLEMQDLRQKIFGFLGRKGYTMKTCQTVLKTYLNQDFDALGDSDFED